jgi:hypothetical protein
VAEKRHAFAQLTRTRVRVFPVRIPVIALFPLFVTVLGQAETVTAKSELPLEAGAFVSCSGKGEKLTCSRLERSSVTFTLPARIKAVSLTSWGRTAYAVLDDGRLFHVGEDLTSRAVKKVTPDLELKHPVLARPKQVSSLPATRAVAAGNEFACALLEGGRVSCWGYGHYGQLGRGTTPLFGRPAKVVGLSRAVSLFAGDTHACAILSSGRVSCWGNPWGGEDGTEPRLRQPYRLSVLDGARSLRMRENRVVALFRGKKQLSCEFTPGGPQGLDESSPVARCR